MLWVLALAALAFSVSLLSLGLLLTHGSRLALDLPTPRSLHSRPVPRTGGIAVLLGAGVVCASNAPQLSLPFALALGLALVSFCDDMYSLHPALRLATHFAAALAFVHSLGATLTDLQLLLLVCTAAWSANLYNFMDGADGVAAGMAVFGFGTYAVAAWLAEQPALLALCVALSAASLAFLTQNFHPARIFLGDVGSVPLGFLAAALGMRGSREGAWPPWFPLLVFGPFCADATVTLCRRALRGERFWVAHCAHYYQRLIRMGHGQCRVACVGYLLMAVCCGGALYARTRPALQQALAIITSSLLLGAVAAWVDWRWARLAREGQPVARSPSVPEAAHGSSQH
jgi:UDP-N-acetylmuramyl pentapeptide phosphotransferase/UDP-N-acetylglucosamine-1-phosphate transferase